MDKNVLLFVFIIIGLAGVGYTVYKPLGLRNNNPGNLRPSRYFRWNGEIGENKGFVVFDTLEHGVRAAFINLRSYFGNGFNTIEKIISRWAPASENNTEAYINSVARKTGFDRSQVLVFNDDTARKILHAIFEHENGEQVAQSTIDAGIALA